MQKTNEKNEKNSVRRSEKEVFIFLNFWKSKKAGIATDPLYLLTH